MSNTQWMKNVIQYGYATREKFSTHTVRVNSDVFLIGECISFVFKQKWLTVNQNTQEKRNCMETKESLNIFRSRWFQCVWVMFEQRKRGKKINNGNHQNVHTRKKKLQKNNILFPKTNKMRTRFIVVSLTFHIVQCIILSKMSKQS